MPKSSPVASRQRRFSSTLAALALALVTVAACDSSTGNDNSVSAVHVNPTGHVLNVGHSKQLVATPVTSSGRIVGDRAPTWTSSNPAVATVDANGMVTAVAGGSTTITASVGTVSGEATLTVWYPATGVVVSSAGGASTTIRQEGAVQLAAAVTDASGGAATGRQLVWTTSNPAVAVVNTTGRASALGIDGTATITATTMDGVAGTIVVTVSGPPEVATVTLSPTELVLGLGLTYQLDGVVRAASGTIITGLLTEYESSNPSAASVDNDGLITSVALGSAAITAEVEGVESNTSNVTVLTNLPFDTDIVADPISDGEIYEWAMMVPAGADSVRVRISGATGAGDADIYVYAPGVVPTFSNYVCRPWLVGSTETCTVPALAGGVRVRIHNYPGEGDLDSIILRATLFTTP